MRIIGGANRGLRLAELGRGDATAHLRPTTDRTRESLFNVLQGGRFGEPIQDAHVLDLFAGTGALGLEALSRGAAHVTFVDNGRAARRLLESNIARTSRQQQTKILALAADRLPFAPTPCALVFLDPPYGRGLGGSALTSAQMQGWIAPGALVVWEENTAQVPPDGFDSLETRRYGDTVVTFCEAT